MKQLLIILTIGFYSCGQSPQEKNNNIKRQAIETKKNSLETIGEKIQGDFNGDGQMEFAFAIKIEEGQGNPIEDGTSDKYEILFSDNNLKSIDIGCCETRLINEGDLNNNGTDEISIFQAPMNGCTFLMKTYSYINQTWKQIVETFLIPTGCEKLNDKDLQKRIFKENNAIYYYDTDLNDTNGKLIKKKVITN